MLIVALAAAGAIGAIGRHAITGAAGAGPGRRAAAVLAINVIGSAVLGAVVGLTRAHGLGRDAVVVIGAGLCGGFTTLSAFAFLTVLLGRGDAASRRSAARYAVSALVLPPLAAGLALAVASA
ncbi:MAG: FluC/FEX family fluoride channel [Actinomycetota bacterium]